METAVWSTLRIMQLFLLCQLYIVKIQLLRVQAEGAEAFAQESDYQ